LDCPLPKLCLSVALSHQDGRHSAVALLLKAALIQVSDNRLLGASGLNSSDRRGQIFDRSYRSLILGGPIVRQTFCCCFVCNGFAKHVPWLLISCLTDCLCILGSKYNGRICLGFIANSVNKVIRSRSVTLSLIGGIRPRKKYMCVYCHMSKKSRVGLSGLIFFFFYYRQNRK
jgi:hypothetical protein